MNIKQRHFIICCLAWRGESGYYIGYYRNDRNCQRIRPKKQALEAIRHIGKKRRLKVSSIHVHLGAYFKKRLSKKLKPALKAWKVNSKMDSSGKGVPINCTAGAIPIKNEKGEHSSLANFPVHYPFIIMFFFYHFQSSTGELTMQKVKVSRYVAGKRWEYCTYLIA